MSLLRNLGFQKNPSEDHCPKLSDTDIKNVVLSHFYLQRFEFTKQLILYLLIYTQSLFFVQ